MVNFQELKDNIMTIINQKTLLSLAVIETHINSNPNDNMEILLDMKNYLLEQNVELIFNVETGNAFFDDEYIELLNQIIHHNDDFVLLSQHILKKWYNLNKNDINDFVFLKTYYEKHQEEVVQWFIQFHYTYKDYFVGLKMNQYFFKLFQKDVERMFECQKNNKTMFFWKRII